jgi:hypothetical protein
VIGLLRVVNRKLADEVRCTARLARSSRDIRMPSFFRHMLYRCAISPSSPWLFS